MAALTEETRDRAIPLPGGGGPGTLAVAVNPPRFASELRALLSLAGPIVLSQLGAVGMNTADTVMVGPLGATALAAAGVGSAVHIFAVILAQGVITGVSPLVSQAYGAGRTEECRRAFVQGCWVALALSVPVVLLSLLGGPITERLGQDPEVARLAGRYLRALAPGVPAYFLFLAMRQFLEGMGIPRPTMVVTFIGLAINVLCNRLLIYGAGPLPALGVEGSGWATSIVRCTMLLALVGYTVRRAELHPLRVHPRRPERQRIVAILRIGGPIGAQMGLEVGLFAFAAIMVGWISPVALAAHQVTINIASTTFMVALGASIAGSVRVGQHIGAGRGVELRHAVVGTYVLAVGCMAVFALLFLTAGHALVRLYTPQPAVIELGVQLLLFAAAFQVFDGAQVAGMGVLRGAADTGVPMLIAAAGYWGIGLPVAYWLGFRNGLGAPGVWAGFCAGLAAVALLLAARVRSVLLAAERGVH